MGTRRVLLAGRRESHAPISAGRRIVVAAMIVLGAALASFAMTGEAAATSRGSTAMDGKDIPAEMLDGIRGNARMVKENLGELRGKPIGDDQESVEWVEGFLERQRQDDPPNAKALVSTVGSYLGEAIIAQAGGAWRYDDHGAVGLRFPNGTWCFPFAKVEKQAANGLEDSISSFYKIAIDFVATGKINDAQKAGQ